ASTLPSVGPLRHFVYARVGRQSVRRIRPESEGSFMSGLLRTWRIGLCAMLPLFLADMVLAQISPPVQLTVEPTPSRGGAAWFDVRLQIPEGYFIPAESRGALKGAWLQPSAGWYSRQLPTYSIPGAIALPGSDRPVLAYSGNLVIRMPV